MKSTLEGINIRPNDTEEPISELINWVVGITAFEQKKEKKMKTSEHSLKDLWENIKCTNICLLEVPEIWERKGHREHMWRHNLWKLS